jgi:predicted DNA-binding WGR domain protein
MIHLTRIDPAQNMSRFYVLDVQPTLFGDWALVREWGRSRSYAAKPEADAALSTELQRRRQRGYL